MTAEELARKLAPIANLYVDVKQDDVPVRGNAVASGDDEFDREVEDEILARLDAGDIWAWAAVTVRVTWGYFEGTDHLGCCCYDSEYHFREAGDYFPDMVWLATLDLAYQILDAKANLDELFQKVTA